MFKKIGVLLGLLFLFFELLFFQSNNAVVEFSQNSSKQEIYVVTLMDKKNEFLDEYGDFILEDNNEYITMLVSSETLVEIQKNYEIKIENDLVF